VAGDRDYRGPHLLLSGLKRDYSPKLHKDEQPLIRRAALHAAELRMNHPVTNAPLTIGAPLPKDFAVALKYLRRYAG
jgi:23S rRNA-/tRNA-specific pseudouridylate synthase